MRAIILAGGLGTRLRPLTDTTPKPLLPVAGKPIMQHAIEGLREHGITNITLAISYQADKIQAYFGNGSSLGVNISYSIEETPLGTGGAVKQAIGDSKETTVLVWGDNLANYDWTSMIRAHTTRLTIALTKREDVEHFGVVKLEQDTITGFVEKPSREQAPSQYINAGALIINPSILSLLPEGKSNIERECFEKLVGTEPVKAFKHQGYWYPTDTLEKYEEACKQLKKHIITPFVVREA